MAECGKLDWQIAVFGQNEARRIGACIASLARAAGDRKVLVTVILNGCTDGSVEAALHAARAAGLPIDVWRIAHADKANAVNRFFFDLRVPARHYCCVDAYAVVGAGSLDGFEQCFKTRPGANLAASVPTNGRSQKRAARQILETGGVATGQFYGLAAYFLDRLVDRGLRLPIGLYRGDGLLGSMAAHDLDALGTPWNNARVPGAGGASFEIDSLSLFSPGDVRRQFRRKIRQMRGLLENAAIKRVIYSGGYEALPEYADEMIGKFVREQGVLHVGLADRPFMALALRHHRRFRRIPAASLVAGKVASAPIGHVLDSGIATATATV